MGARERIDYYVTLVDENLERYLPEGDALESGLIRAIRYSLRGGKRLRPVLTLASAEAVGGKPESVVLAGVAMEYIHGCSLILDDLPSMDNAVHRRGRMATHLVFGESTAVLAAHALLTHAFKLLALNGREEGVTKETVISVVADVASLLGIAGLIGGQYLDLQASRLPGSPPMVETIHTRKTAALFVAAASTGAALCNAGENILDLLRSYAENLGRAFQNIDDLLDRESAAHTTDTLGGQTGSPEEATSLTNRAKEIVQPLGQKADTLVLLADIITRRGE